MNMFLIIFIYVSLINFTFSLLSSSNTFVFSGTSNSYIAFDSWRPCLTGYVRFDIRTNTQDGTLAYIDDRGKFDFFYLKLIEGKLRLLFNLGSDRQAINVNMKINDDQWHTVLIKRNGQTTILSIDHGFAQNSTVTHSEDLHFGGAVHNEYEASPFYFGGIPSILERPSSGNLSSFDVYMQPRFRGQLRNLIYKNCSNPHLIKPIQTVISGNVSLIPNHHCSGHICSDGLCLITDNNYTCFCDETTYQGRNCEAERQNNELTFHGKQHLKYELSKTISSSNEILTFQFKTDHYNGLLFQLIDSQIHIKLKQGQLIVEYRLNNNGWYESPTKDLDLIDNQWHYVQINRKHGQITLLIDDDYLPFENELPIDQKFSFKEIFIGGNNDLTIEKFHGCLKDISLMLNENFTIDLNQSSKYDSIHHQTCKSLINPLQFLTSSSFLTFQWKNISQQFNLSFRFETFSSNCILLYSQSNEDFLGLDLIDGFFYLTINFENKRQRQEFFQQRLNDGQSHFIQLDWKNYQGGIELSINMDSRQNTKMLIRNVSSKINFQTFTIGGINPSQDWLPTNYFSGIMHRGLIGCFSDLEINNELINLTKYINYTNNNIPPKSGPCSATLSTKRECLCEHNGECQLNNAGIWSCDCSKTGFTGRQCEQIAYHTDLNEIQTFEFNTKLPWSDQMNDIAFGLQAIHDEENFLQIRSCRLANKCDSIHFSVINGLLHLNSSLINLTSEYPFLLDKQWHSVHLQRFDTNIFLHIDNQITQQRIHIINFNSSLSSTIWVIFNGGKEIRIEDLRLYDQSIYSKLFFTHQNDQIKLKHRLLKPLNVISLVDYHNSHVEIQLRDILCQECQLGSIYFQFRTTESNGVLLFANIQTENQKISSSSDKSIQKSQEYLLLKLVNGHLHLLISAVSSSKTDEKVLQIQTKLPLNNGQWHHISLHRPSNHHAELRVNSNDYFLPKSIHFLDKIFLGRPLNISSLNHIPTIRACFASLTMNRQSINLREYITANSQIRNDCFLDSQCPLKQCQNTGICRDRIQCDCQHTSFQGKFCTDFKIGYSFKNSTSGLIFDQPFSKEKPLLIYKLSFGIVTKMNTADIIRINDQISIELYRGFIRIKIIGDEFIQNNQLVNDGYYHLIQIEYNRTGYLSLTVDKKSVMKQVTNKLLFDKPLVLFIGQNPVFKHPFQGQLYGLESDIYSIFDLISPTFQRIAFTPRRTKSLNYSPIIDPSSQIHDDFSYSSCLYQPSDDICIVTMDKTSSSLTFLNRTMSSSSSTSFSSRSTARPAFNLSSLSKNLFTSAYSHQEITSYLSNSTDHHDIPPLIISIRTPNTEQWNRWKNIWIYIVPILCGIIICVTLSICLCMKYRRKDAGVYELEETQRFRPLIVEIPPSPGANNHKILDKSKKTNIKSHRRKRKKAALFGSDEQREFYI